MTPCILPLFAFLCLLGPSVSATRGARSPGGSGWQGSSGYGAGDISSISTRSLGGWGAMGLGRSGFDSYAGSGSWGVSTRSAGDGYEGRGGWGRSARSGSGGWGGNGYGGNARSGVGFGASGGWGNARSISGGFGGSNAWGASGRSSGGNDWSYNGLGGTNGGWGGNSGWDSTAGVWDGGASARSNDWKSSTW